MKAESNILTLAELIKKLNINQRFYDAYFNLLKNEPGSSNDQELQKKLLSAHHIYSYYLDCAKTVDCDDESERQKLIEKLKSLLQNIQNLGYSHSPLEEEYSFNNSHLWEAYLASGGTLSKISPNFALLRLCSIDVDFKVLDKLISLGADINIKEHSDFSKFDLPLSRAIDWGELKVAQYLIGKGANIDAAKKELKLSDLSFAAFMGDLSTVKFQIASSEIDLTDTTPLCNAAKSGQVEVVKFLLDTGFSPNITGKGVAFGNAVMSAVAYEQPEVIQILFEAGGDPNLKIDNLETYPLLMAASYGNKELVDVILKSKVDVDLTNERGKTAADVAKQRGHVEIEETIKKFSKTPPLPEKPQKSQLLSKAEEQLKALVPLLEDAVNSRKYKFMSNLSEKINKTDYKTEEELTASVKAVILLALQHRKRDPRNTTKTGKLLKNLLNDGNLELRSVVFGSNSPIQYRSFRKLLINKEHNSRFFSMRNKNNLYKVFEEIDDKEFDKKVKNYISGNMKR